MNCLQDLSGHLDEAKLARLGAALWSKIGKKIELEGLTWAIPLLGTDGDRLLFEGLQKSGALDPEGKLSPVILARCLHILSGGVSLRSGEVLVVWTLPVQHPDFDVLGHTYREGIVSVVESARKEIIILSPYLQEGGMDLLMEPLLRALGRGVHVAILTHGVEDVASAQSRALEKLRREARFQNWRLSIYAARSDLAYILHAKMVVADEKLFIIGSANITEQGLGGHLEAGIMGREPQAGQIKRIIERTINSGMADLLFCTRENG